MAGLYALNGDFAKALSTYEKALGCEPDQIQALLGRAEVELKDGDFAKAKTTLERALERSRSPEERIAAYQELLFYYLTRGEFGSALQLVPAAVAEVKKARAPVPATSWELEYTIRLYQPAGQAARALELLQASEKRLGKDPNLQLSIDVNMQYSELFVEMEDATRAAEFKRKLDEAFRSYGIEIGQDYLIYYQGRIDELNQRYLDAVKSYEEFARLKPLNWSAHIDLGRTRRKMNELGQAEAALRQALKLFPSLPEAHYELAVVYDKSGDTNRARAELKSALAGWANADATYKLANDARALATKLGVR
jgi:tetratricopeptide (TPR) repeat protein